MPATSQKRKKYISYFLRFAGAAAALYLAFRGEDFHEVTEVLLGLNLWVFVAAVAVYVVSQLIFVFRWSILLRVQGIKIGYLPAVRLHFLGLFYNNCLPSSVGGDLLRAYYVTHHTDKKLEAALSVFVDRAVGLTGMCIMAFGCYWFLPAGARPQDPGSEVSGIDLLEKLAQYQWILFAVVAILVLVAAGFASNKKGRTLLRRLFSLVREHGIKIITKTRTAIKVYYSKKLAVFFTLLLTFCCQGIFIFGLMLIGWEMGLDIDTKYYFILFPISWLLGTLPISVGGAGIMEWWLKIMFISVCGIPGDKALALALCQRLIWLTGSLPGVVIHLAGAHLPKDFFIDYKDPVD